MCLIHWKKKEKGREKEKEKETLREKIVYVTKNIVIFILNYPFVILTQIVIEIYIYVTIYNNYCLLLTL